MAAPTIIDIDVDLIDQAAQRLQDVEETTHDAQQAVASARITPASFGMMASPLAATVAGVASHADDLMHQLATVSPMVASATAEAARGWRQVEEHQTTQVQTVASGFCDAL
jgi:hypothetical protein